jgi:hypothetical protein
MAYEIDFLPVGDGSKSGDAIALRYGNLGDPSQQMVIVIDGGYTDDGETLVDLIRTRYNTSYSMSTSWCRLTPTKITSLDSKLYWNSFVSANCGCIGPGCTLRYCPYLGL